MLKFLEFTKTLLTEAKKDMLDISIPSVQKTFKTDKTIESFLTTPFRIEEKLDGCLEYNTQIKTKEFGFLPIGKIVDEQIHCSVLSFNHKQLKEEFKPILGFKNSGSADNWFELKFENGKSLTITDNHWVWSETKQKYKQVAEFFVEEELLVAYKENTVLIKKEKTTTNSSRYDIEVEDNKNFFANDILVHNTKLSLIRNSAPFDPTDYTKNWILSYKNHIIYPFEFEEVDNSKIKKESHGISQYKFIHKVFLKIQSKLKNMPENHEFFLEYLMKKPTLTRSYSEVGLHNVIFLSHSPTTFTVSGGKIKSNPTSFIQEDVVATEFSKITKFNPPPLIFTGPLTIQKNDKRVFNEPGIVSDKLQARFTELSKDKLFGESILKGGIDAVSVLAELFTSYDSEFGGNQIEGSVLFDKVKNKFYKFTLDEQYSKELRKQIQSSFSGTEEEQKIYYDQLEKKAEAIFGNLDTKKPYEDLLKDISKVYKENLYDIINTKKTNLNKQDDLYLKLKLMLIDLQDPHSSFSVKQEVKDKSELGFFVGKMRIITNAHIDIIKSALKKTPKGLIIALVNTSKKGLPFEDRKSILTSKFGTKVKVVKVDSANFARILEPFKNQVSTVYCGEDNEVSYTTQLETFNKKNNTSILLDVASRSDSEDEISATKIEGLIKSDDFDEFKTLTPRELWKFWEPLRTIFS